MQYYFAFPDVVVTRDEPNHLCHYGTHVLLACTADACCHRRLQKALGFRDIPQDGYELTLKHHWPFRINVEVEQHDIIFRSVKINEYMAYMSSCQWLVAAEPPNNFSLTDERLLGHELSHRTRSDFSVLHVRNCRRFVLVSGGCNQPVFYMSIDSQKS